MVMPKFKNIVLLIIIIFSTIFIYMKVTNKNINEMGLSFFQMIKTIRGEKVNLDELNETATIPIDHQIWNDLVNSYVRENGDVDYNGFLNAQDTLQVYLDLLSHNPPSNNWTNNEKLAYWINAYNAFTIKLIIDHYPLKSIKDIAGNLVMINSSWDLKFFKIGGVDFDLNTIEHDILRKQFDEPRIHFAINCASISCPNLRNEAFISENLEKQLEEQAALFINDSSKNMINKNSLELSPIFDWFKSDFTHHSSLVEFLSTYSLEPIQKDAIISYLEYDWNLNEI